MGLSTSLKEVNKKSQILFSLLTVVAGFYMMWGSLAGKNKDESTLSEALSEAVPIDSSKPSTRYIGKLVTAAGRLSSIDSIEDEFIKTESFLVLNRKVEMYQWIETPRSATDNTPEYSLEWVQGQSDFLSFQEPTGHENPVLKYDSKFTIVSSSKFGAYDGHNILKAIRIVPRLPVTAELLKDPTQKIVDGVIYISRGSTGKSPGLGDMRISYEALKAGDYTIAARQADETSLVGSEVGDQIVIKPGLLTPEELFGEVEEETKNTFSGLLYVGGAVFFVGIFSTLVRAFPKLDLRPKFELQGIPAVFAVSGVLTVATMLIISIMEMIS